MTQREINRATRMLAECGRVVTGTIINARRPGRTSRAIESDGDGRQQNFGTPRVFYSIAEVREYCDRE